VLISAAADRHSTLYSVKESSPVQSQLWAACLLVSNIIVMLCAVLWSGTSPATTSWCQLSLVPHWSSSRGSTQQWQTQSMAGEGGHQNLLDLAGPVCCSGDLFVSRPLCNNTATAVNTTTEGGGVAMAASWHGKQDVVSVSHHCSLAWLLFLYQQNE
jgi:hypothetical protein